MEIKIIKKVQWENVYLVGLCKGRREKKPLLLVFDQNDTCIININLSKNKYIYFTDLSGHKTDMIIISDCIETIELKYSQNNSRVDAFFGLHNEALYKVENYSLKDEKNLLLAPNNTKVISLLVPKKYDPSKEYNLLVMFDGQNMYDKNYVGNYTDLNDGYGGWQIDVSLDILSRKYNKEFIVLGIETTGHTRMFELTQGKGFGKSNRQVSKLFDEYISNGHLDNTIDFVLDTAIPFVKEKYIISSNIGIGGSSAGGNASLYAGLKHQDVFKYILPFSPAFSFFDKVTLNEFFKEYSNENSPYVYICTGNLSELEKVINKTNKTMIKYMKENNYPEDRLITYFENTCDHNEVFWRYGFLYMMNEYLSVK